MRATASVLFKLLSNGLLLTSLTIGLLLTACGGGGGGGGNGDDGDPVDPPPPPPASGFTLSGTVRAIEGQAVDSDTNDPARIAIPNDTPFSPQPIPNPVTLGGYVNVPGAGAPGRSTDSGDEDDYFRVDLRAGQRITLLVADYQRADADLYLFDTEGNILDFTIEDGNVETLVIAQDGSYVVNVYAFAGATNYTLVIGAPETDGQALAAPDDVLPWQAVVQYRDDDAAQTLTAEIGATQRGGGRKRARLLALDAEHSSGRQRLRRYGPALDKRAALADPALRARWETLHTVKTLRRDPRVAYAAPNYRVRALARPNDELYRLQWHYPLIGLPEALDTTAGNDVVVAVVDTGVLAGHPDLRGQLVGGYDFVRDPARALDGDGIDPDPEDAGAHGGGLGYSHGTPVTGIIAARGNNGMGVVGAAYGARVMPLRALGADGEGTSYDVEQAVRFAAGLPNDSGTLPLQSADIINLSLGGPSSSQASQNLYSQVRARGILVVAAAGNDASSTPIYPAAYNGVLSVSAVDTQRRLAPYSNTGPTIDLAAPGGNSAVDLTGDGYPDGVLSTNGNIAADGSGYNYSFLNGTSLAAPHVAGVLALMKSVNPTLTPDDIDALLVQGALTDDLGAPGRDDQFGYGLINAAAAVRAAVASLGIPPVDSPRLVASVNSLNFASSANSLTLALSNGGGGDLMLTDARGDVPWLTVEPIAIDRDGLGDYRVSVDRGRLQPGTYTGGVVARSTVNTLTVQVVMAVAGPSVAPDVGVLYILLTDPETQETVQQVVAGGSAGNYPFRFTDVPPGTYQILAGSDADNDLLICDQGEACGAWLTIDQPIRQTVNADLDGIDFTVDYLVALPQATATSAAQGEATPAPPLRRPARIIAR